MVSLQYTARHKGRSQFATADTAKQNFWGDHFLKISGRVGGSSLPPRRMIYATPVLCFDFNKQSVCHADGSPPARSLHGRRHVFNIIANKLNRF